MNKRQKKKKLRKRKKIYPNIITEFRDITRIEWDPIPDEILQEISDSVKKIMGTFKPIPSKDIPSIVPVILDEDTKIEVYDIIIQEDNNNDKKSNT